VTTPKSVEQLAALARAHGWTVAVVPGHGTETNVRRKVAGEWVTHELVEVDSVSVRFQRREPLTAGYFVWTRLHLPGETWKSARGGIRSHARLARAGITELKKIIKGES
jgi:hypothetical protein